MEEIVVVSCTNRPNSNTLKVSKIYSEILKSKNVSVKILDFCDLPNNIAFGEVFGKRSETYAAFLEKYIVNNHKFIFVVPEYNGSFPGLLKLFLDTTHPKLWTNKEVCLVGVSLGRAGNLRGMDQLTGIFNFLKVHVFHNKLPISGIDKLFDDQDNFNNADQLAVCTNQIESFIANR